MSVLLGCTQKSETFTATDVTGADFAHGFSLTAQDGTQKSLQDFKGKIS